MAARSSERVAGTNRYDRVIVRQRGLLISAVDRCRCRPGTAPRWAGEGAGGNLNPSRELRLIRRLALREAPACVASWHQYLLGSQLAVRRASGYTGGVSTMRGALRNRPTAASTACASSGGVNPGRWASPPAGAVSPTSCAMASSSPSAETRDSSVTSETPSSRPLRRRRGNSAVRPVEPRSGWRRRSPLHESHQYHVPG